jgi:hypothetical protein
MKIKFETTIEVTKRDMIIYYDSLPIKEQLEWGDTLDNTYWDGNECEKLQVAAANAKLETLLINYGAECGIEFSSVIVK